MPWGSDPNNRAKRFAAQRHVEVAMRPDEGSPVDEALALLGLKRFVALSVHSSYGALVVAARSDLVAAVPEAMAHAMQASLRLEVFKLPAAVRKLPRRMAWHPRFSADPVHTAFRNCLTQVLDERNWQRSPGARVAT